MLDEQTASQLGDLGLLSRESLDQLYTHVAGENAVEENQTRDIVAQQIAEGIANDPAIADVAERVSQYAALPQQTAAPVIAAVPTPVPPPSSPTPMPMATPTAMVPAAVAQTVATPQPEVVPPGPGRQVAIASDAIANAAANVSHGASQTDILDRVNAGINMQKAAVLAGAQAARSEAAQTSALYARAANDLSATQQQFAEKRAKLDAIRDDQLRMQVQAVNDAGTLQIDPNHFWANSSTQQRVAAGIGIMLSMAGGGRKAIDVIDAAIKDDINLQKANIELKLKGLDVRDNLLSQMHNITGDLNDAEKLTEAAQLNQVKFRIEQAQSAIGGSKANSEAMMAIGQLEERRAKLMSEVAKNAGTNLGVAGEQLNSQGVPTFPENFNPVTLPAEARKSYVVGVGLMRDADAADRMANGKVSYDGVVDGLKQLKELRTNVGVEDINSTSRAKGQALWTSILNKVREMERFGALDVGSVSVFEEMLPKDPLGAGFLGIPGSGNLTRVGNVIMGDRLISRIDQMRKDITSNYYNKVRSNALALDPKVARQLTGQSGMEELPKAAGSK